MFNFDKIFLISDIHFGTHTNSVDWMNIQSNYFKNFFIPILNQHKTKNSSVFMLGDIFDNRTSLNVSVMNMAISIIEKIASIMPINILIGNHDIFYKSQNSVNSLSMFKHIPNVKIFEEPGFINVLGKTVLMMPWVQEQEKEKELVSQLKSDYLFCHTSYHNAYSNLFSKDMNALDVENFKNFRQVFSGHIHRRQNSKNFTLIGSPYATSRADLENKKGIYVLNMLDDSVEFIENNYSPEFVKLNLDDILDMTIGEFKTIVDNNFVDIIVESKWATTFPFSMLLDLTENKNININVTSNMSNFEFSQVSEESFSEFNLFKISYDYIASVPYNQQLKDLIKKKFDELSKRAEVQSA